MGTQLPEAHGSDEGVVGECTGKTAKLYRLLRNVQRCRRGDGRGRGDWMDKPRDRMKKLRFSGELQRGLQP